jgi:hypothetical protein
VVAARRFGAPRTRAQEFLRGASVMCWDWRKMLRNRGISMMAKRRPFLSNTNSVTCNHWNVKLRLRAHAYWFSDSGQRHRHL